jgi:hypothetical protein
MRLNRFLKFQALLLRINLEAVPPPIATRYSRGDQSLSSEGPSLGPTHTTEFLGYTDPNPMEDALTSRRKIPDPRAEAA